MEKYYCPIKPSNLIMWHIVKDSVNLETTIDLSEHNEYTLISTSLDKITGLNDGYSLRKVFKKKERKKVTIMKKVIIDEHKTRRNVDVFKIKMKSMIGNNNGYIYSTCFKKTQDELIKFCELLDIIKSKDIHLFNNWKKEVAFQFNMTLDDFTDFMLELVGYDQSNEIFNKLINYEIIYIDEDSYGHQVRIEEE